MAKNGSEVGGLVKGPAIYYYKGSEGSKFRGDKKHEFLLEHIRFAMLIGHPGDIVVTARCTYLELKTASRLEIQI